MSKMATAHNAINLSQGFPNFPVDEKLTDIVARLAKENVHQYTPMAGYPPLMNKIAKLTQDSYNRTINPDLELLVTAGATQGIFTTILALVKEKFFRRCLIKLGYEIINSSYITNVSLEKILTECETKIFNITTETKNQNLFILMFYALILKILYHFLKNQ